MMEGYRKASRPHFPECEGCKLFYGCSYGKGQTNCRTPWECKQNKNCVRACWYVTARDDGFRRDMCTLYRQFHIAAVKDDADAYRQAIIAATGKMLTNHMLPTAELMHRTDIAAIILDELERRGEYQKPKEAMRL